MENTLILGMGNVILSDDAIGIIVVRELQKKLYSTNHKPQTLNNITFKESEMGGLRLLELLKDFDKAIIVDSIITKGGKLGDIYKLTPDDFPKNLRFISIHDIGFLDALKLANKLGIKVPQKENIIIYAIEIKDNINFGEKLTKEVEEVIPLAIDRIIKENNLQ